jgi:hypothetical protein
MKTMLGLLSCARVGAATPVSGIATVRNAKVYLMHCLFMMHLPLLVHHRSLFVTAGDAYGRGRLMGTRTYSVRKSQNGSAASNEL